MNVALGKLERVDPRSVWAHEAHEFTPWLAENVALLGDALGLDLEVSEREAGVGDFSLDILATDVGRDRKVVIENQLEATDHGHLGQLITYAAGFDAPVVVWIAREIREEHRQALDWLNRGETDTEFFGVVVEVLRIDGSKPAVNLKVVASPNNWSRGTRKNSPAGAVSERQQAYLQFHQRLIDELREKHHFTNAKAGQPANWYNFATGTRGFMWGVNFCKDGKFRVECYIDLGDAERNEAVLDRLLGSRPQLEAAFGDTLEWERLDTKRACRVACYTVGSIDDPPEEQEKRHAWAVDRLLRFKKVFGPMLPELANTASHSG